MIAALARIKRAVREAVSDCGGVDGAGLTAGRNRSVAGDWNNLNHRAFPPLDCALALDEVCLARGDSPPILSAYAAELGHVCVRLIEIEAGPEALAGMIMRLSARLGEISGEMAQALSDGVVEPREARRLLDLQADHDTVAAQLRLALQRIADGAGPG